jgi:hypothetical protein
MDLGRCNFNKRRLLIPQRQAVTPQAEFDGISERCSADYFDLGTIAEAHLEQTPFEFPVAANGHDLTGASDTQAVQLARRDTSVAARHVAFLVHDDPRNLP